MTDIPPHSNKNNFLARGVVLVEFSTKPKHVSRRVWMMIAMAAVSFGSVTAYADSGQLDFTRDIRPILSNHCWSCHGPDSASREAGLRLDRREDATKVVESGATAIVPHRPEASELIARIESTDEDLVMPPKSTQKPLNANQRELLRRWIAEGAPYEGHWAFETPRRPPLPVVQNREWPREDLDYFILDRLEKAGLSPSPETDRGTWLRRVTLDLTGLPPTPAELEAFLADESPNAYAAVVDCLLESPRHAERMAMHWLDVARYADTNGYNNDELRTMWPWRDWVIRAFQSGMPYDKFLTEQLAGDLLPNATLDQKVATGFNRNHVLTTEGGIIEEEYRVEYVADRIHTTATVFFGLSMQCARCHDHKFDPVSQHEYYRFAAFFNNIPDKLVGYSQGRMAEPLLKVPSPQQQAEQQRLEKLRDELAEQLKARATTADEDLALWERSLTPEELAKQTTAGLVAHFALDEMEGEQIAELLSGATQGTIHGKVSHAAGKIGRALEFDGGTFVDAGSVGEFEADQAFSVAAWIRPTSTEPTTVLSKIDEGNAFRGYDVILEGGKVASHFVHHWPDRGFKVITKEAIALNEWHHVLVTYDGSRQGSGVKIYVDGQPKTLDVTNGNKLDGTLKTDKPFHIGKRSNSAAFKGHIDEVQIFSREIPAAEATQIATQPSLGRFKLILAMNPGDRTEQQRSDLRTYFLEHVDVKSRELRERQADVARQLTELDKSIPVTMVMGEMNPRRPTYFLRRGQYDQRGDEVQPGVPSAISGFSSQPVQSRLDLARWLTDPAHPLTARVAVNRWWEMLFGTGLVETAEDFGVQSSPPTHPELLDWLATELVRTSWDQRKILKQMVLSATYRQRSDVTPQLLERDPDNRLLSRGPRYRLPAETVRDSALAVSGLLQERIGGPSVKPYQPEGLWEDVSVERREKYVPDMGEGLYRRSMYTFWKRTCPPPSMSAFDAPDRETCVIRRARTNTPLQALVLLNDPTYVEAARKFAERVMTNGETDAERLKYAVKVALCRDIRQEEAAVLTEILSAARQRFGEDSTNATKLLSVGYSPVENSLDKTELAAWATVASVLLNLDETISKR